jgi:hypothetical protein
MKIARRTRNRDGGERLATNDRLLTGNDVGVTDLALNSPATSVIGNESRLLAVLARLGFGRKNHRSALNDFSNTIGTKRNCCEAAATASCTGQEHRLAMALSGTRSD